MLVLYPYDCGLAAALCAQAGLLKRVFFKSLALRVRGLKDGGSPVMGCNHTQESRKAGERTVSQKFSSQTMVGLGALCAATFTAITTELAPIGLMLEMARTFGVGVGQVGLAVSAYALIVAVIAVPLTRLTAGVDRKKLLLSALSGYVLTNVIGATAPSFAVLCVGRVIGGASHALLMSMVSAYAAHLVPERQTGRAISIVFGGASLGGVLGVPGAAAIGHFAGWRVALWVAAALAAVLTLFIAAYLPRVGHAAKPASLVIVRAPGAMRAFVQAILANALFFLAQNVLYTYIAPVLMAHGLSEASVSVDLLVIGACSLSGLWAAGLVVDKSPRMGLLSAGVVMIAGITLLCGGLVSGLMTVAAAAVWCAGYAGVIPFIMSGAIRTRATSADIAGAAVNSTSNIGILLGSAFGGKLLASYGVDVLAPTAIGITILTLLVVLFSRQAFPAQLHDHSDTM